MRPPPAALTAAGCGAATAGVSQEALAVSARDAYVEARSIARSWSSDARLRWVEGIEIGAEGRAAPDRGQWEFHYTAPGQTRELVVSVAPLTSGSEEQPVTSPPGFVIGDNALNTAWIDSGAALQAVAAAGETTTAPASLFLVPTRPVQWIVRVGDAGPRWRVHAETGEVLP